MTGEYLDKVLGCIIGATIGDSVGGPIEFTDAEFVRNRLDGKEWLQDMLPYKGIKANPHGIWVDDAPRGTGTDDTRLNHIFLECVIENKGRINPQLLALEYVHRYQKAEEQYPKYLDLAVPFFEHYYMRSCAFLGMDDPEIYHQLPLYAAKNLAEFPMLYGLLTVQSAGLLCPDNPEKAYKKAYELSFLDVGYARDATAILAAVVSAALGETEDVAEILETATKTNPFNFRSRRMIDTPHEYLTEQPSMRKFVEIADKSKNEKGLMVSLATECRNLHPFDPLDVLGVPLAVVRYHKGDPVRSILSAANHRLVDEEGKLVRMRDVDCIAMVTGVIVGAINGLGGFPKDWIRDAIQANKSVYNLDIEKNARDFYHLVYQ